MTFKLVQNVIRRYDGPAKMTLIILADMADDDGFAWPGQSLIAVRAGKRSRQVRSDLQALGDAGVLSVIPAGNDPDAGGRFGTNRYTVHVDAIAAMPIIDSATVGSTLPSATEHRRQESAATVGSVLPLAVGSVLPPKRTLEEPTEKEERGAGADERPEGKAMETTDIPSCLLAPITLTEPKYEGTCFGFVVHSMEQRFGAIPSHADLAALKAAIVTGCIRDCTGEHAQLCAMQIVGKLNAKGKGSFRTSNLWLKCVREDRYEVRS